MIEELITVIIPVYNVEKYIDRCIQSVLQQEYKNLQIILVDDGSTDRSGKICDSYKESDKRITVIHKENGGLSSARNCALDIANGNYITFVDSDDWLHKKAIVHLYEILKNENADVSGIKLHPVYDEVSIVKTEIINNYTIFSKIEAFKTFLFEGYLTPCACGKLWASKLWLGIRFPDGKLFEDQYTIYKVIEKADILVLSDSELYHYYKRPDSIGHSPFSKRTYDLYDAVNIECDYICSNYSEISTEANIARLSWHLVFINMMLRSSYRDRTLIKKTQIKARKYLGNCIRSKYLRKIRKVQIIVFGYCLPLYKVLYYLYKIRHKYS